jgi:hypothetical protein
MPVIDVNYSFPGVGTLIVTHQSQSVEGLKVAHLQQRDDRWVIVDLFGKGTVLVPGWVKAAIDE